MFFYLDNITIKVFICQELFFFLVALTGNAPVSIGYRPIAASFELKSYILVRNLRFELRTISF